MTSTENHHRDIRSAQTMACHAVVDMYATHQLPPLSWDISDLPGRAVARLDGHVTEHSGDEAYRRQVLAGYAAVIHGEPYTFDEDDKYLKVDGTYEGVTVRVFTVVTPSRGAS